MRKGNNFSSFSSPDGAKWTEVSTVEVPMPGNVYVGLAVTSHNDSEVCTAEFDAGKTQLIKK